MRQYIFPFRFVPNPRSKNFLPKLPSRVLWKCALILLGIIACMSVLVFSNASTSNRFYAVNDGGDSQFEFPMKLREAGEGTIIARFTMHLPAIHPTSFHIVPDDCLEALDINGVSVSDAGLPLCDYTLGHTLDLSQYLHRGENSVVAHIHNNGGDAQLLFESAWSDPVVLIPSLLILFLLVLLSVVILLWLKPAPWVHAIVAIFLCALFLRTFYVLSTPYWIRGHDTDGHIEYMDYIEKNNKLPPPNEGWEYWQPPLYYITGAAWLRTANMLGLTQQQALFGVQLGSLLLSLLTLGAALAAGLQLFPDRKQRTDALPIYFGLIAFFPGLLYLSARINNDVLAAFFAFSAAALLIAWWRTPYRSTWIAIAFLIGLHLLTKNTGLLLIPIMFGCLLFQRNIPWKKKLTDGALALLIIVLVSGWFNVYRMMHDSEQDLMVGNTGTLNSGLVVPNDAAAFTVFNPVEIVRIPYNNPWDDASRRQYFWEYWYRSAFFGEFHFGEDRKLLASWILITSLLTLVIAGIGCWKWLRTRTFDGLPLLFMVGVITLGHAAFRWKYPYGSSQDFRYALLLLIPFAACVALAVTSVKAPLTKKILSIVPLSFILFCAAFLIHA